MSGVTASEKNPSPLLSSRLREQRRATPTTGCCVLLVSNESAFTVVDVIIFIQCIFVSTGEALTEEVEVQLPQNVVDGSARISLSVLGKINHCVVVGRQPFSSAAVC